MIAVALTERQTVRLISRVDWENWSDTQVIIEEAGNGATRVLRACAERLGLSAEISRAASNVILIRLSWNGTT